MNEQEKIQIIQALFKNVNSRDYDASDPYIADNYQAYAPTWNGPLDRDQIKKTFQVNFTAFPDLKYELQDVIVQGDKAAATWEIMGTHQGDLVTATGQTVPATNRPIRFRASTVYEFKDGRIVRQESYFDTAAFLIQLGLLASSVREA